jgi:predicted ribosome quality control (RQC) complex YloA/Tae2 family protein
VLAELSGIEIIPLTREIGELLARTYVNNVFSIGDDQVVRFRLPGGVDRWLLLSPRHGAWVSEKVAERSETTEFTSKLRSEIERQRFSGASQVDTDRVFEFALGEGELSRKLILELMPPGNIVVTDAGGKVLLALRETQGGRRRLRRGDKYAPPIQTRLSPRDVTGDSLREMLKKEKTLGGALGKQIALPRKYVREIIGRVGLTESGLASDAMGKADEIAAEIAGILEEARNKTSPCLARTAEGNEIFAITPRTFEVVKKALTMSSLCDEIFTGPILQGAAEQPTQEDRWRKETEVTINRLLEKESGMTERAKDLRKSARSEERRVGKECVCKCR